MNFLFISSYPPIGINGGVERVIDTIIPVLKSFNDTVFTMSLYGKNIGLPNHIILDNIDNSYAQIHEIESFITNNHIDIIVVHNSYDYRLCTLIYKLDLQGRKIIIQHHYCIYNFVDIFRSCIISAMYSKNIKKVIKISFFLIYFFYSYMKNALYFYRQIKKSSFFLVLSKEYIGELKRKMFFLNDKDKNKIKYINNPLSISQNDEVNIKDKKNIILFVGRLSEDNKNIKALLNIWKIAEGKLPKTCNAALYLVGDGPDHTMLQRYVCKKKINSVKFCGKQKPDEYYKEAKVLCLTSREGWGLVILEAMQYKTIPVCYDSYGALHDMICDGKNGFLIKKNNRNGFADRIIDIIINYSKYYNVAERAEKTCNKFHPDKIVNDWKVLCIH
jgi:glycosyltransferase involved in cell wall biosynthesis